jgi:hypothetical protein
LRLRHSTRLREISSRSSWIASSTNAWASSITSKGVSEREVSESLSEDRLDIEEMPEIEEVSDVSDVASPLALEVRTLKLATSWRYKKSHDSGTDNEDYNGYSDSHYYLHYLSHYAGDLMRSHMAIFGQNDPRCPVFSYSPLFNSLRHLPTQHQFVSCTN